MKTSPEDLALFGGEPAFEAPLHVGRPHVGDRDAVLAQLADVLDRKWLTNNGPRVQELEQRLEDYLGVEHCVTTCNGTIALHLAARALGLTGEVLVPSFTFVATVHALAWQGLRPVFCDVDPETHNLDPEAAERLIGEDASGIVGVHLWGRPCDVEGLSDLADRRGLKLMFDAAQAFGCSHHGQMIGGFGDAEVLSFHATKVFNTFEGGAIVTNDGELADRARLMRNFGFADYDEVIYLGINGKMTEMSAAMGLASLNSLDEFVEANRANYEAYRAGFADIPGLSVLSQDGADRRNYHHIVLDIDEPTAGVARDVIYRALWAENVLARRYFFPGVHRMEPYRSKMPHAGSWLPVTEQLADRMLALPTGGDLGPAEVSRICGLVGFVVENGRAISDRLAQMPS